MLRTFRRLRMEYEDVQRTPGLSVLTDLKEPLPGQDVVRWITTFRGADGTPYAGGTFLVQIEFPSQYPFKPLRAQFLSRIFHPNISSQTGVICLDVLKDQWSAAMNLTQILLSIQALLESPNPSDPQDQPVAEILQRNQAQFKDMAQQWTRQYASMDSITEEQGKILSQVQMMGFHPLVTYTLLTRAGWDIEKATLHLLELTASL